MRRALGSLLCALLWSGPVLAQVEPPPNQEPTPDLSELVNALLGGAMGPVDEKGLQKDVEEAGGVPFRRDVPVDFLNRQQLGAYLRELFDEEYPKDQALVDQRLLQAFDLLPASTDLRALRAKVLEENVAGFYDERPGKRRLYTVSEDRTFTPMNQIVLAHEMRHALQDQYADLHDLVTGDISDFDDRRIAVMSLFEGDATLVMERFVKLRLGVLGAAGLAEPGEGEAALAPGLADVPGAPPVVRDQLVQPYLAGLVFARALFARGGGDALRQAWSRPPQSSEQILHPELYFSGERPRSVTARVGGPPGGRLLAEGVLGELLLRTLLEEGHEAAAAGWGGDGWKLWDARGRTLLCWRSEWDTPADAAEFHDALLRRFTRQRGVPQVREGWTRFGGGGWSFAVRRDGDAIELASADDTALLEGVLSAPRGAFAPPLDESLDIVGGTNRVPMTAPDTQETTAGAVSHDPGQGEAMATSTPPANQTNLGMAPNMAGLLCYVPCCIGLVFSVVVAIVEKQSRFARFHAFQSLLLHAIAIVIFIGLQVVSGVLAFAGIPFIGFLLWLVQILVGFGVLGVAIFLMIKANAGEELELPVIGPMAKGWA